MFDQNKLIEQLQQESQQIIVPDVRNHVKARYLSEHTRLQPTKKVFFRRPLVQVFTSIILILLLVIGLSNPQPTPQTITLTTQEKEHLLLQSITGATLLLVDEEDVAISYQPLFLINLSTEQEETTIIHDFILSIEQLLSLNDVLTITTSSFSNMPNYTYQEVISFTTIFEQTFLYTLHYNIMPSAEDHIAYTLQGILLIEDESFLLSGYKETIDNVSSYHIELEHSTQNMIQMQATQNNETFVYQFAFSKNQVAQEVTFWKSQEDTENGFGMRFKRGDIELEYFAKRDTTGNKISLQAKNNARDMIIHMEQNNNGPFYEYFFPGSGNAIPMNPKHPHHNGHPGRRPTSIF